MEEEEVALNHLRMKVSDLEIERRDRTKEMEQARSLNDYFSFLVRLLKEEDKVFFFKAMEQDKLFDQIVDQQALAIDIES